MKTFVELSKVVILIVWFVCVLAVYSCHRSPSFFLRGHSPGYSGSYWYTTRSSHTGICRLCELHTWFCPFIQPPLCVMYHIGVTCHSDSQWTEEVPDPPEKRNWSHWGFTGQQRPIQCLPCCVASSSSRWNPPKPPNTGGNAYLSALCFPGLQVYYFYFRTDSYHNDPKKYWIVTLQSIHTV